MVSAADRADWLHWARGRAGDALERGRAAEAGGDLGEARRWLERARRLAPGDATVAVSLGGLLLRQGDPEAAESVLAPVAEAHDLREAWSGLAVCALQRGRVEEAVAAMRALLSRHAPDGSVAMLAALVAERAGLPGWCGVCGDGRLSPAQPAGVDVVLVLRPELTPKYLAHAAASSGLEPSVNCQLPSLIVVSQMSTWSILTPCDCALSSSEASHCGKAGSSLGPGVEPLLPAPDSEIASALPCALAKAMASSMPKPVPVPVGFHWLASG